jgi:hypothetical protein
MRKIASLSEGSYPLLKSKKYVNWSCLSYYGKTNRPHSINQIKEGSASVRNCSRIAVFESGVDHPHPYTEAGDAQAKVIKKNLIDASINIKKVVFNK